MNLLLIDTDVASFVFKGSDFAKPYLQVLDGYQLSVSFMTVAELFQWAFQQKWGDRRIDQLEQYLLIYTTIPIDEPLCREWAKVRSEHRAIGRVISPQDAWIAATALRYNLPLVTHNIKDFQQIPNLKLLKPEN